MNKIRTLFLTVLFIFLLHPLSAQADELKEGDPAPLFKAKLHTGEAFNLESQKGHWTVLYFFPKSETPGCTAQANAFSENIQKITGQGAKVFGISTDSVKKQNDFHKNHKLKFSLISDESGNISTQYGAKMPLINMAKRWTFILDDQLVIRKIDRDVKPDNDVEKAAEFISKNSLTKKSENNKK